jgi:hypothetical protein
MDFKNTGCNADDSTGSDYGSVVGSSDHGNELPGSINVRHSSNS